LHRYRWMCIKRW